MPGGKSNIKPSDNPKPFIEGYQVAEIWTEEKAIELGKEMLDWLKADELNVYIDEFIVELKDLSPNIPKYLSNKFSTFSDLYEKCKAIKKRKLLKHSTYGTGTNGNYANANMAKFDLINNHDMVSDNSKHDLTTNGEKLNTLPPVIQVYNTGPKLADNENDIEE